MAKGDIIGAGISGASSLLGSIFSSISANKQIKAQQRENQLNREFNAEEAEKSRDYNSLMTRLANEYNSPIQERMRMEEAGINPALAYSNGYNLAEMGIGTTGQMASSSGAVGTSLPDYSGIINAGQSFANFMETSANTSYASSLRSLTDEQLAWLPKLNQAKLFETGSIVFKNVQSGKLDNAQIPVACATAEKLHQEFVNLGKVGQQLDIENATKYIDFIYREEFLQSEIFAKNASAVELFTRAGLNQANAKRVLGLLSYEMAVLSSQAQLNHAKKSHEIVSTQIEHELAGVKKDVLGAQYLDFIYKVDNAVKEGKILDIDLQWESYIKASEVQKNVASSFGFLDFLAASASIGPTMLSANDDLKNVSK